MREALAFLYSRLVVESLVVIGAIALFVGRLRRRLRVVPDQSNRAPLLWLVNFTADARLHRRFRRLAAQARAATRGGSRHRAHRGRTRSQRLAMDLQDVIVALDERLIASRDLDFDPQRAVIRELRSDAARMEDLIDRVTVLVKREDDDPAVTVLDDPIGDLAAQLDQLETAAARATDSVIETSASSVPSDPAALTPPEPELTSHTGTNVVDPERTQPAESPR